jgi:hypothetical protein
VPLFIPRQRDETALVIKDAPSLAGDACCAAMRRQRARMPLHIIDVGQSEAGVHRLALRADRSPGGSRNSMHSH